MYYILYVVYFQQNHDTCWTELNKNLPVSSFSQCICPFLDC